MIPAFRANELNLGREAIDNLIDAVQPQFLIQVRLTQAILHLMLGIHNCFIIPNDLGNRNIQDFRTRLPRDVQLHTVETGGWSGRAFDPWNRIMSIRVRDVVDDFELKLSWEEVLRKGSLLHGDTLSLWMFFQNHEPVIIIRHDGKCKAREPLPSLADLMHHPA